DVGDGPVLERLDQAAQPYGGPEDELRVGWLVAAGGGLEGGQQGPVAPVRAYSQVGQPELAPCGPQLPGRLQGRVGLAHVAEGVAVELELPEVGPGPGDAPLG